MLVMAIGVQGFFAVNSFVVPILIIFNFTLMFKGLSSDHFLERFLMTPEGFISWRAILAAFSYSALNLALAQAVLVPIAVEMNDLTIVKLGGTAGRSIINFNFDIQPFNFNNTS